MRSIRIGSFMAPATIVALTFATATWAQSTIDNSNTPQSQPQTQTSAPARASSPATTTTQTTPGTAQSVPGLTPVGGDQPAPPATTPVSTPAAQPGPGTTPVGGDAPAPAKQPDSGTPSKASKGQLSPCAALTKAEEKKDKDDDNSIDEAEPGTTPAAGDCLGSVDPDKVVDPGSQMIKVKPGSIEDVSAIGNRNIGGRGLGNWYSIDSEIRMGKQYADMIDKSAKFITDPIVDEYINRLEQNIVKNSDCKVPFTIKVIDSDEINSFALPGGFVYMNSGLILAADEEAELAAVMGHETAHVCAHHAARQMTRMNYAELGSIPLMIMTGYSWTGYGIYEATRLAIPVAFLDFQRGYEAQADYLGVQYMYRAGYDPQAFILFFEKIEGIDKRKPGLVSKIFSDHPLTPERILHTQEEIARILPAKSEYLVTTSEFEDVKARLARIENKRRLIDSKGITHPSLRRASTQGDGTDGSQTGDSSGNSNGTDQPTLHRRDDQQN